MPQRAHSKPPYNRANLYAGLGLIGAVALAFGSLGGFWFGRNSGQEMEMSTSVGGPVLADTLRQNVHEHSDFAVFVNGQKVAFDAEQFLSTEAVDKSPSVHVHAPRTNVAHIHKEQTTYDEFFRSLGMELTDTCLTLADGQKFCDDAENRLRFMVNGVEVDALSFERMTDMGRVLIAYGPQAASLEDIFSQVTDEACIPGENCVDRLPPGGPEKEPCSRTANACH